MASNRYDKHSRIALEHLSKDLNACVFVDAKSKDQASVDNLKISYSPSAVIKVKKAHQVGIVLKHANQYRIPVTAKGAGSSTTGAAVPIHGGWVIDLSLLKDFSLNPFSKIVSVGVGFKTEKLQDKLEEKGLFYPPDPSSKKYSTIGGNIACNAGGMRCVKYGVTRDYILGLEGYLANGSFVSWGLPLKKNVSGFNLKDLWIGSEGTLGIVTKAHLKCIKMPEKRWMAMYAFKNEETALKVVSKVLKMGLNPSICEFLDKQIVECAEKFYATSIFKKSPSASILIFELDGNDIEIKEGKKLLTEKVNYYADDWVEAKSPKQAEAFLDIRRSCSQSMFSIADTKLNEDVVVPIERQYDLIKFTKKLKREIELATPTFGHAGDGNLHVHIMYNHSSKSERKRAKNGILKLMKFVVSIGGSITGEHGIGLAKTPFLKLQHSEIEIKTMRLVKKAFDPKEILNPGKIFNTFDVWSHEKVKKRLPWDH